MTTQTGSLQTARSWVTKTLGSLWNFVKKHPNIVLLILSIVLVILAVSLTNLLVRKAYAHEFSCAHLVSETLGTEILCAGVKFQIGPWNVPIIGRIGPFPSREITILPGLKAMDGPLDGLRRFVVWNIILAFGVVSLVVGFIAIKLKDFIKLISSPDGRKAVLTNVNIWLLIFAIFCGLFYFGVVANR